MMRTENLSRQAGEVGAKRRVRVPQRPTTNLWDGAVQVGCGTRYPHPPRFGTARRSASRLNPARSVAELYR